MSGAVDPVLSDGGQALAEAIAASGAAVGVAARDLAALDSAVGPDAIAAGASEVAELGGRIILLGSVRQASPELDRHELRDAAAAARAHGVALHANIGALHENRYQPEFAADTLAAADDLEIAQFHTIFGLMEDRFSTGPAWSDSLIRAVGPTRRLLDRADRPLVLRTHEEMTTFEAARFLDEVDHPALRIAYSPVNVVCRVEDPLHAYDRVDSRTTTLFLDDGEQVRVPTGADRRLRPLGEGTVDWLSVLRRFGRRPGGVVLLDLAQATFDVPFYDADWLAHQPDLTPGEFARFVQLTRAGGARQSSIDRRRAVARQVLRQAHRIRESTRSAREPALSWLAWLDTLDEREIEQHLGGVFEHSSWVAAAVAEGRPYRSLDELHRAMMSVIRRLPEREIDAFLARHPDLGADAAGLTTASSQEQAGAGLLTADASRAGLMRELSSAYRRAHGFPLIVAVRGRGVDDVVREMHLRQTGDTASERERALEAIGAITRMRLDVLSEETASARMS